ncbi:PAS domain-containing protein [Rhizobium sp. Root1220]|uniref:PAS domain-containing protein n=1 Tax=Rhizobium sp. Root1220 TaxID=1736432 RepID=UPI0006F3E3D3|nr:PAS domain-containing protein [Rhizobium sp. Root1220]KQV73255.1 PAS domain-containing sensor histidine kinase [Rhizobium sp. Root1220]
MSVDHDRRLHPGVRRGSIIDLTIDVLEAVLATGERDMEREAWIWAQFAVASAMAAATLILVGEPLALIAPLALMLSIARGRPIAVLVIVIVSTVVFALILHEEASSVISVRSAVFGLCAIWLGVIFLRRQNGCAGDLHSNLGQIDRVLKVSSSSRAFWKSATKVVRSGEHATSFDTDLYRDTVEALKDRELELRQLVDMVPSNLWRLTAEGEPVFFNKRMVDYLGFDVAGVRGPGTSFFDNMMEKCLHPDDLPRVRVDLKGSLATGAKFAARYRLRRHDGVYRWVSGRAECMRDHRGEIVQWYGLSHDVDDQVRAEEALQRSEWHLQHLIDSLPVNICSWTPNGAITYASKRLIEEFSPSPMTISGLARAIKTRVHRGDRKEVQRRIIRAMRSGKIFEMRYRRATAAGAYRWMSDRFEPVKDKNGAILEWYAISIDVDDEMRVQQTLRESERSLQQLVETLPTLIYCADPNGKPIYRSKSLQEFLGFNLADKDEAGRSRLDGTLEAIIHPDDLPTVKERYARSLATGEPYAMKHRLRRFDGQYRWVETRTAAMRSEEGKIIQWNGVCIDIDDLVQSQEELRRAQRNLSRASEAAKLAELTASIAHEVSQPLSALVSSSDASLRWLQADPPKVERAQQALERVIRSANIATSVVSRIRALFRRNDEERVDASMQDVVAEARELMAEEGYRKNVRIDLAFEANMPSVLIDRVQIQQVVVNLIRNGLEAMDDTSDRSLSIRLYVVRGFVQTEVRDTGPGVIETEQLFEPFFTTKGQGMGMGLAICRSIVEAHGGRLWVEPNTPRGAAFVFSIPSIVPLRTSV